MKMERAAGDWHEAYSRHFNPERIRDFEKWFGRSIVLGERDGPRFQNAEDGTWLFNCHCNGGTFNLGHRHPQILDALREALGTLDVGNHWFPSPWRARLAQRLSATTDGLLPGALLCSSGGEATDTALKFSRWHTGRPGIVSAVGGFHGTTGLASAAGAPRWRDRFHNALPGFEQVPFDDLEAMERTVGNDTAAVILEAIPATLGMPIPSDGYFKEVERICRRHGALLIVDEIQTGLGRTGTMWFYQQAGAEPDIVLTGKGLGAGLYPVASALLSKPLMKTYATDSLVAGSTYGASELGCAVGLAVLDLTESPGFLEHVRSLAERFRDGLGSLNCELRQRGLFMGLKWPAEGQGWEAAQRLYEQGIWAVFAASDTSVTQYLPPLIVTDAQADDIIARTNAALAGFGAPGRAEP